MKQIINGKTYNTETAKLIVRGDNNLSINDIYYRTEELYRTKKGNYFIVDRNNKIWPITDGKIERDPTYYEVTTVQDWLSSWNIGSLPAHEKQVFNIIDA